MSETERSQLSQDEVYHLLSNPRRRFIISYLRDHESVGLQDLASEVAAWENDTSPEQLTDQQKKRVYVSLYQTHIPKLEDAGIITYDSEASRIHLRDRIQQLDRYLPEAEAERRDWRRIYLTVAVVGTAFYLLVMLNVPLFAAIPEGVGGALILLAVASVAVLQYLDDRRRSTGGVSRRRNRSE
jgi:DNA-binding transcriptional ArsR family regulator